MGKDNEDALLIIGWVIGAMFIFFFFAAGGNDQSIKSLFASGLDYIGIKGG